MIDLDALDARLDLALTGELRVQGSVIADGLPPVPAPAPAPVASHARRPASGGATSRPRPSSAVSSPLAPPEVVWEELDIEQHGRAVVELVSQARLAEADLHIAAHAELAHKSGRRDHRADAAGWAVMRALLDGREGDARAGVGRAERLGSESLERYWMQRFALASTLGDDDERYEVLDHCRERAYCLGDLAWGGRLTLLLAQLGRRSEACREFDATIGFVMSPSVRDAGWLDLATDLADAAAVLGDVHRTDLARRGLTDAAPGSMVVVGRAWVCKGSVARYQALVAAAAAA